MKRRIIFMIVICILLIVTGCTEKNLDMEQFEEDSIEIETPTSGGELVIPITQFETLNPILNTNRSVYYFSKLVYDGLIQLDEQLRVDPQLAKNWSIQNDKTLNFVLRDDVVWHDGEPFTAQDVKFTIEAIQETMKTSNPSIYSDSVRNIKSVKAVSQNEVVIEFENLSNTSIELFQFPIIPKHQFRSIEDIFNQKGITPIGTGKYRVTAYNKLKYLKLDANKEYWVKKPLISKILVKVVPDKEAALTSVEANEVSLAEADNFDWEKYNEDKTLKIYEYTTLEHEFMGFNFNHSFLANKNLRKAIAYSIDRHLISDDVYLGHTTVTDVPIHPDSWLYAEEEKRYGIDISKAKEFLIKANWKDRNEDGVLENELGQPLILSLLVNEENNNRLETAQLIGEQLKRIGVEVIIESKNWEEYQQRIFSGRFDLVLGGWQVPTNLDISYMVHSEFLGGTNFSGYSNSAMDQLLTEATFVQTDELRREKLIQVQKLFIEDVPYFSLFFKNHALVIKENVKGDIAPKPYDIYHRIEKWYIKEQQNE